MSELEDAEEELSYGQATFRGEEDLEEGLDESGDELLSIANYRDKK